MTREEFQKLTQDVVLLDGATGSNLAKRNLYRSMDHGAQRSSAESAKGLC